MDTTGSDFTQCNTNNNIRKFLTFLFNNRPLHTQNDKIKSKSNQSKNKYPIRNSSCPSAYVEVRELTCLLCIMPFHFLSLLRILSFSPSGLISYIVPLITHTMTTSQNINFLSWLKLCESRNIFFNASSVWAVNV